MVYEIGRVVPLNKELPITFSLYLINKASAVPTSEFPMDIILKAHLALCKLVRWTNLGSLGFLNISLLVCNQVYMLEGACVCN